ncbi:cell division protein FtsL [Shewanella sp. 202IG2-18]|uniref:cell division protein FtsL n=1 Tax=Parashewanella hymeniacidonis TaxID=2807618 RepID=UPI001961FAB5|nr:cell division protein FtsL [Parashewanella hymeniacidonis]MBM7070977.1 cell division protein FtsL [Parashewanella hymeniacidonis]
MTKGQLSLPRIIFQDLMNHKVLLFLSSVVIFSALAVVYYSHETRELTNEWDRQLQERDSLDIEWRNLLLEEQAQTEHSRIIRIATKDLHMKRPLPKEEIVVKLP